MKPIWQINLPSKTFLLGEYLVLQGGPCLIATSEPYFQMQIFADKISHNPFHPDSPAGKYYQDNIDKFHKQRIEFLDPHQGQGGFGASSAQFAGLYAYLNNLTTPIIFSDVKNLLATYHQYAYSGQGIKPSGADVIAQLTGNYCFYDPQNTILTSYEWPFSDIQNQFIHTGFKVATHEHLATCHTHDFSNLEPIVRQGMQAWLNSDSKPFIKSITDYQSALSQLGLSYSGTESLLEEYKNNPSILAAKGCGALGADVLLLLYKGEVPVSNILR